MVNKIISNEISLMQTLKLSGAAIAVFVPALTAAFWIYSQFSRIELAVPQHVYEEHVRADSIINASQSESLRLLQVQIQQSITDQQRLTCHVYEYPRGFCDNVRRVSAGEQP